LAHKPESARRALYASQFLDGVGAGLVYPVAVYYAQSFGARPALITLVLSLHALARLLTGPAWGGAADRLGRRRVLLGGIGLAAAGHLVFALAPSLWCVGLGRLMVGAGSGNAVGATAILADTTGEDERTRRVGELRACYGLGLLLGPILGGALATLGLRAPACFAAALGLGNLLWAALLVPEPTFHRPIGGVRRLRRDLLPLLVVATAASFAVALAESVVPLIIKKVLAPRITFVSWPVEKTALALTAALFVGWGLCLVFVQGWAAGRLARRHSDGRLATLSLFGWAGAFALTPACFQSGLLACVVILVCSALTAGLVVTCLTSLLSKGAERDQQGLAFGSAQSSQALGEFLGPAVSGSLFEVAWGLPYYAGAASLALAWLAWMLRGPEAVASR
jgi:MFS family permease